MQGNRPSQLSDDDITTMREEPITVRIASSQVMSVRFSAEELRKLAAEAAQSGITVGALVKRAALDAAKSGDDVL